MFGRLFVFVIFFRSFLLLMMLFVPSFFFALFLFSAAFAPVLFALNFGIVCASLFLPYSIVICRIKYAYLNVFDIIRTKDRLKQICERTKKCFFFKTELFSPVNIIISFLFRVQFLLFYFYIFAPVSNVSSVCLCFLNSYFTFFQAFFFLDVPLRFDTLNGITIVVKILLNIQRSETNPPMIIQYIKRYYCIYILIL